MKDNIFIRYLPLVLLAILWEIAPRVHIVDPSELPPLSAVAVAWWSLLLDGDLWTNGISSFVNWSFGLGSSIIIGIALVFDYVNGFHDAANSIATVVSTRVLSSGVAVLWAAVFNFLGIPFAFCLVHHPSHTRPHTGQKEIQP